MASRLCIYTGLVVIIIFTTGCRKILRQRIIDHYEKYNQAGVCAISINDLTSFEWDKMYVFGSSADNEFISCSVGFEYNGEKIKDGFRRIIFSWGVKEIYEEDYKPRSYLSSVFDFSFINDSILNIRSYSFSPEDAFFMITKEKISGSCSNCFLYLLIHLENNY
jgi:hypothetical protein